MRGLGRFDHGMGIWLYSRVVKPTRKYDRCWRKSRIAARLLYRRINGPLRPRDQALARKLAEDPEVENRLIQQALFFLAGSRKYEVDQKLVAGRD